MADEPTKTRAEEVAAFTAWLEQGLAWTAEVHPADIWYEIGRTTRCNSCEAEHSEDDARRPSEAGWQSEKCPTCVAKVAP